MKVAVFGCLHGMLNDMYESVDKHENETNSKVDLILVCGDCQTIRHHDDLQCLSVPQKYRKIGDFHEYYSGKKKIPKLTIFVSGNHEASNYLMTLPYGGWVCDNFYYLGYSGVIRYKGLRIAGISGIYNFRNCNKGRFECMPLDDQSIRSIYHTRRLDVFRLQLLTRNIDNSNQIDVFLSHDWPARIYNYGNLEKLLRFKPAFRADVNSREGLGNPLTEPLINQLKPRRWFGAHLHCKFYAKVEHNNAAPNKCTEFLSLNKIEGGRRYVEFIDIEINEFKDKNEAVDADEDDNLYYDEEWLTILRKTLPLESSSRDNVSCPSIDDDSAQAYFPTEEEIQKTTALMILSGGLKIEKSFQMSEPVIYNRADHSEPSIDKNRIKYYSNPQHEKLCSRLQIKSTLHQHEPSVEPQDYNQARATHNHFRNNPSGGRYYNNRFRDGHNSGYRGNRPRNPGPSAGFSHQDHRQPNQRHHQQRNYDSSNQVTKKRAYELDEDGCLPFYIDKGGEKL